MKTYTDPIKRFWNKVDVRGEDDCWEFQGALNSTGRGAFSIGRKNIKAHRYAYETKVGAIPDGMLVCHHCDNGKCCNPKHLFLGTMADNVRDMINKGRKRVLRGDDDPKSKLNSGQVLEIVHLYKTGFFTQPHIARMFGVSRSAIESILNGYNWNHVTNIKV